MNNNSLQIFTSNEGFTLRSITDTNGVTWFVAKDIATALDYSEATISNMDKTIAHVPDCWKGRYPIPTVERGIQEMLCLTEQGVYFFLGRSDKPKALPYQLWIAGDIVPSIRKTGTYSIGQSASSLPQGVLEGAKFIFETAGIKDNQLTLALDKVYKSYTGKSALLEGNIQLEAPVKEQALTPSQIAEALGFGKGRKGARIVNKLLEDLCFQCRLGDLWQPLPQGEPFAVMMDTGKKHSDGTPVRQLKWNAGIIQKLETLRDLIQKSRTNKLA